MQDLINAVLAPFQYEFMRNSLMAVLLVGSTCALIGVYVVLRRMAFIGDALAHTALPGLVVASLNGWNVFGGAIIAGLLTAFGIGWLSRRNSVREDTAIGILFTAMFAIGILLISTQRTFRDFHGMLFGNILSVTQDDLILTALVAAGVVAALFFFHKELELTSFDPVHAQVIGLKADRLRYLLLVLLAFTVVTTIQAVGVVLTSALLITPAATASLLTNRLPRMMLIAVAVALVSGFVGLVVSYNVRGASSGAAIVLACTVCFFGAWLIRTVQRALRPAERNA
jgi:ABC-type Mn2+/Zn2+ transport system permease subunit